MSYNSRAVTIMTFWLTVAINVRSVQCSYTCQNIALRHKEMNIYIFKMFLLRFLFHFSFTLSLLF